MRISDWSSDVCSSDLLSWYFIIANGIRNATVKARADKVINGFWGNGSTQDAIRELEAQPRREPFSKIALDAASAVAHPQQATASASTIGPLAESLSRSEFIERALRQAVARESLRPAIGRAAWRERVCQ